MPYAENPGIFPRQAEHQKALLTGPAVRRVLADSLHIGLAVLLKLAGESPAARYLLNRLGLG